LKKTYSEQYKKICQNSLQNLKILRNNLRMGINSLDALRFYFPDV